MQRTLPDGTVVTEFANGQQETRRPDGSLIVKSAGEGGLCFVILVELFNIKLGSSGS